jgi:glycosyltransferase involved in cell wall biosynthesis
VTTSVGAESIAVRHGEDILIADRPADFAEAVVALHSDEALWSRLAANGLRVLESQFSVAQAQATVTRILELGRSESDPVEAQARYGAVGVGSR